MKKIILLFTIASILIIQFHTYARASFPYTHDGENHLARFANYKIALKEGQYPPRFAPNLMNHYGYPVFNFNYPLANLLSIPFSIAKVHVELTFKLLSVFASAFGLIGLSRYFSSRFSSLTATVFGLLIFGLHPYLMNIILYRGNIGELLALELMPWLLFIVAKASEKKKLVFFDVLLTSAFLLSHNVTVLLFVPWLILFSFVVHFSQPSALKKLSLTFILALLMSCWFWIPALMEAKYTVLNDVDITKEFSKHFLTLGQLLWSPLQFGFSLPVRLDSLSFQVGVSCVLLFFVTSIVLIKISILKIKPPKLLFFIFLSLATISFLQLYQSKIVWNFLKPAQIIQFPWRLSIFFPLLFAVLYAEINQFLGASLKRLMLFFIFMQAIIASQLKPVDFFHKNQIDYDLFSQSTSTQNENRTKTFVFSDIAAWEPHPTLIPEGQYRVLHWDGTKRNYTLDLTHPTQIIEPTMNFPGWTTKISDSSGQSRSVQYVFDNITQGRVGFFLQPGTYVVDTHFTQKTPARIVGNSISLITIAMTIVYTAYITKNKHATQKP